MFQPFKPLKIDLNDLNFLNGLNPQLSRAEDCPHFFASRSVFFRQAGIAGDELDLPQRKYFWIDVAVAGNSSLVAQHFLAVGGKNETHE